MTDGFQCKICKAEVQLCPVRVVHKFDFRLVINETRDNGKLWKMTCNDTDVFLTGSAG